MSRSSSAWSNAVCPSRPVVFVDMFVLGFKFECWDFDGGVGETLFENFASIIYRCHSWSVELYIALVTAGGRHRTATYSAHLTPEQKSPMATEGTCIGRSVSRAP